MKFSERTLVGIEACATSHYWSRELKALGHNVRLMPPAYVKPYVKRQKNDAADAKAICEAVTRANMRIVETKTPEQQSCLMLHRTRRRFFGYTLIAATEDRHAIAAEQNQHSPRLLPYLDPNSCRPLLQKCPTKLSGLEFPPSSMAG